MDTSVFYKRRKDRLIKLINLDAPAVVIGHAAVLLAEAALCDEIDLIGHKPLIERLQRWDADLQREIERQLTPEEEKEREEIFYDTLTAEVINTGEE